MEPGFFQLRSATDLLAKLEWEFGKMQQDPLDPWLAFNFFVTAEHLPDWVGDRSLRNASAILRICSHLANGGKHFVVDRHRAVASTEHDGVFEEGVFETGVFEGGLIIVLELHEAEELNFERIEALKFAELVIEWWRQYSDRHL